MSSGNYTSEASLFAEDKPIWLIDGSKLLEMVAGVQLEANISSQVHISNQYQQALSALCVALLW